MTSQKEMGELAQKYQLENGKDKDYYSLHKSWAITKRGQAVIANAEGITHTMPEPDVGPCFIAYRATFTTKGGREVHAVGSCRFDSGKNNPESTHAPEMAWKRLKVRGVLEAVGAQGVYGEEEFTQDFRENGPQVVSASYAQVQPPAPVEQAPPQVAQQTQPVQPAPTPAPVQPSEPVAPVRPDGTNGPLGKPPGIMALDGQKGGWFPTAGALPSDWKGLIDSFQTACKGFTPGEWEVRLMDAAGTFKGERGYWKPSSKYPSYASIVGAVDGEGRSKAGFAMSILTKARGFLESYKSSGYVDLLVPDGNGGAETHRLQPLEQDLAPAAETLAQDLAAKLPAMPEDVPF